MSIETEVADGQGLTLAAAGRLLPGRNGNRISPGTVFRWTTKGAKAADGSTVKLETARVGSSVVTTRAAIARFVAALSAPAATTTEPARSTSRAVEEELDRLGL